MVDSNIPMPFEDCQELSLILMGGSAACFVEGLRRAENLAQAESPGSSDSNKRQLQHEVFQVESSYVLGIEGGSPSDAVSSQSDLHNIVWKSSSQLSSAIRSASKPNILVVDGEWSPELDGLIRIAVSKISNSLAACPTNDDSLDGAAFDQAVDIGIISESPKLWRKRWLLKLYQWLIQGLLGVRKPYFKAGFVRLSQRQKKSLVGMDALSDSVSESITNTEQLLALLRLQGSSFVEHETRMRTRCKEDQLLPRTKETLYRGWQAILFWWNEVRFPARQSVTGGGIADAASHSVVPRFVCWTVLLLLSCVMLLWSLDYPLFEPDETRNAQIAYNIVESGNWLGLTLNDEPYRNKPPALAWMTAVSYKWFGISPRSTRLPCVLATIITLMIVLGWGEKVVGLRAAFLASMALLLSVGFVVVGRYVVMDAGFTCCIMGMSLALILAEGTAWRWKKRQAAGRRDPGLRTILWLITAGVFAGIGVMFKGPAIFVLVLPPVLAAYALEGRLRFFRHHRVLYCLIPCLMIGSPWFLAMAWFDPAFLGDFLWRQNLMRFTSAFDHEAPWWFYLPVTLIMMFPASYLLPALVRYLLSQDARTRGMKTPGQGFLVLMSGWVILIFSCSESKIVTYILPAIPFLALLIGAMLDETLFQKASATRIDAKGTIARPSVRSMIRQVPLHNLPYLSPLGFVLASVLVVFVLNLKWNCPLPGSPVLLGVGWVVLLIIALIPWGFASSVRLNWICLGTAGFALMLTLQQVLIPNLAQMRSLNQSLIRLSRQGEFHSAPVVFFDHHPYAAELEMPNREIKYFKLDEAIEFRDFIAEHPLAVIVTSDTNIKRYCRTLAGHVELARSEEGKYIYLCQPRTQTAVQSKGASSIRQR